MLRSIAALASTSVSTSSVCAAMRLEAEGRGTRSQVGYSRLAHLKLPISGKPEIGGGHLRTTALSKKKAGLSGEDERPGL
jgi:hypothetical protein